MVSGCRPSWRQGRLDEVKEHVESLQPPNMVRQYGLEQASFAGRPDVARYLLESGATLHSNAFSHADMEKREYVKTEYVNSKTIFHILEGSRDIIAMLEVFLDTGWHPNQPWHHPQNKDTCRAITSINGDKLVVKYLVERLPDLRFAPRHGSLYRAVITLDTELLDLLLLHGADATVGAPLFELVDSKMERLMMTRIRVIRPPLPFSSRRATAEWLLQHNVPVNGVAKMPSRNMVAHSPLQLWQDETALSLPCRAEDWEFAEWLLENGADPELLEGRALQQLWWSFPEYGKNGPSVARELVEKVRHRHGGNLPAEGQELT